MNVKIDFVPEIKMNDYMLSVVTSNLFKRIIVNHNRDYFFIRINNEIIGLASLFKNKKLLLSGMKSVVTLSIIQIEDKHRNKGYASLLIDHIIDRLKKTEDILCFTQWEEDGELYIKKKFTKLLEKNNVLFIPSNLSFIYKDLSSLRFNFDYITKKERISIMYQVANEVLKTDTCKKYNINSIEKLNINFMKETRDYIKKIDF